MTTGKPNKTLLGLPSDLEAAVKKLKEDEAARAGHGAPTPSAASADLSKTQYGNPHGSGEVARTYHSAPAPQPAKPAETRQDLPPAFQQNSLNRTLIGMRPAPAPSSPVAGTAPHKAPAPAQPVMQPIVPVQVVQVRGREAAAPVHAPVQEARGVSRSTIVQQPAPPPSQRQSAPASRDAAHSSAAPAQFVQESRGHGESRSPVAHSPAPEAPVAYAQPSSGGGGVTDNFAALRAREAEIAALRAREAEAAASAASPARSATHTATAPVVEPNARPSSVAASAPGPAPAQSGKPMAVTRLAGFDTGVLRDGAARDAAHAAPPATETMDAAPRLSLSQERPGSTRTANRAGANAPKRWPALSLLGLAVVAFGGVIVLRAPQLLPPPLAALVTGTNAVPVRDASPPANVPLEPDPAPDPDTRVPGVADSDPHEATTVNAATAAPDTAPAAVAAPASVGLTGVAAQLEKEAIDLVLANDYTAASRLYEQLRAQVPGRREYPIMIELLTRAVAAATCGKPGQEPCATP